MDIRLCFCLLSLTGVLGGCDETTNVDMDASSTAVADAHKHCAEAAKQPTSHPFAHLPVEKFDECIAVEANKWPGKTRETICAFGKSGGAYGSPVEVYMLDGKCRTDYE